MEDIHYVYDVFDSLEIYASGCPCRVYHPDITFFAKELVITLPPIE
jgi:hypothetical protein